MNEILNSVDTCSVSVTRGGYLEEKSETGAWGHYDVVCHDQYGQERWRDEIFNVVFTEGKNYILDQAFAGAATTPIIMKMGLIVGGGTLPTAGQTYSSHSGWIEDTHYANRITMSWAAAASGSKSATAVVFTITSGSSLSISGCDVIFTTTATPADATAAAGILLSSGDFSGGPRTVNTGDTISVTYSFGI